MNTIRIRYCFTLDTGSNEIFDTHLNADTMEMISQVSDSVPGWTKLDFHQCAHCPLASDDDARCPVALSLMEVVQRFGDILSHDSVDLKVIVDEREVRQHTSAQRGLSALIGLRMATSGCPHMDFFKPMARFHLPLASEEETIFRVIGMYLLAQHVLNEQGQQIDPTLSGLKTIYENVHQLNASIANRLRAATQNDSSVNALVLLDLFTLSLSATIDDKLEDIRHWFTPHSMI